MFVAESKRILLQTAIQIQTKYLSGIIRVIQWRSSHLTILGLRQGWQAVRGAKVNWAAK